MTGMAPSDVYELTGVSDPRVSPDGRTVAFVVGGIDSEANEYRGRIWLADLDGSTAPRAFTSGARRDAEPCWSPDGSTLAFTSNRDDGKTMQLFVMPVSGGEPRRLTDLKENVTQLAWSPDGATIAFAARVRDAAYDESDDRRRRPRRFTRLQFKLDHVGWTADRPQHVFTVKADGSGAPVQLTGGDFEDAGPRWSPDGATIAFISARHPFWDVEHVTDIYLVAAGGGEPRRLTQGGGAFDGVSWSPDGTRLAGQRYPAVFDDPRHTQIAVVDAATGDLRLLTGSLDRNCSPYPPAREPIWDGDDIVFLAEDRGNTHVFRVAADGAGEPQRLVAGERVVSASTWWAAGWPSRRAHRPRSPSCSWPRCRSAARRPTNGLSASRRRTGGRSASLRPASGSSPTWATPSPRAARSWRPNASPPSPATAQRSRRGS